MSMQTRILKDLMDLISQCGFESEQERNWANTGSLMILKGIEVFGSVSYEFQSSWKTMKFDITIGREKLLSQPPRPAYHDFYMKYSETDQYKNFRNRLESELKRL